MKENVVEKIRSAGGEVYAVTSEPQYLADQAHEHWELNFPTIGDPHQEIPRTCSERGWLTLYANQGDLEFLRRGVNWDIEHPKGFFQPGVLAVTRTRRLLYRWRSVPSDENMQGTLARPTAGYVWNAVESALAVGAEAGDAVLDNDPVIDRAPAPRFLFFAALLANGWFLRLKSLVYSPGMTLEPTRIPKILARWPLFLAVWIVALVLFPSAWVGGVFAGWLAWVVYDSRRVMRKFQLKKELVYDNRETAA